MKNLLFYMIGILGCSFMVSCGPSKEEINNAYDYAYRKSKHPYEVQAFIDKYGEHIDAALMDSVKRIHRWLTADSNLYIKIKAAEDIVEKYDLANDYCKSFFPSGTYAREIHKLRDDIYDEAINAKDFRSYIASRNELYKRSRWMSKLGAAKDANNILTAVKFKIIMEPADVKTGRGKGVIKFFASYGHNNRKEVDTEFEYSIINDDVVLCDVTKESEFFAPFFGDVKSFRFFHRGDQLLYRDANHVVRVLNEVF